MAKTAPRKIAGQPLKKNSPKKKQLKDSSETIIPVKINFEKDLNDNIDVKTIRSTDEDAVFVFASDDQDLELHNYLKNKVNKRFDDNDYEKSAEIEFYLDKKMQKIYLKDGRFYFNHHFLVKLDDYNLYDPEFQDPEIFVNQFLNKNRTVATDGELFNKFEAAISPKLRTFVVLQKFKSVTFDTFKREFILKYKKIHFASFEKIVLTKFNEHLDNLEDFVKEKMNSLKKLMSNCSKEEFMVKLVICSLPDKIKEKFYINFDYTMDNLLKRVKDLKFIEKLETKDDDHKSFSSSTDDSEDDKQDERKKRKQNVTDQQKKEAKKIRTN